jgi:6,7-dimethyl-8-ribityllumazine synthase
MKKIAIITTKWNAEFVGNATEHCLSRLHELGVAESDIEVITVPWAVEIPLTAKLLHKTGNYKAVIAIALVYGGGIYRHEFVAQSVVDQIVKLSSELSMPIFSSVLTPVNIDMKSEKDVNFYLEHLKWKGTEVADACMETLAVFDNIK